MAHRFTAVEIGCEGPFEILTRRPHGPVLKNRIEQHIRAVLDDWGLAGEPRCSIRPGALKPIDVRIHERSIDYRWATLATLRSTDWSEADSKAMLQAADDLVAAALMQNPSAFMTPQLAAAYVGHPVADDRTVDSLAILRSLLWLGVSVEERSYIRERIIKARERGTRAEEIVESLFADMRGHLRILVTPAHLSEITTTGADEVDARSDACEPTARKELKELEQLLYLTAGIQLPDITWAASPQLAEGTISLQANTHREVPVPVPDGSLTTVLASLIQRSAHRLLGVQDVESQLAQLQLSSPELVQAGISRVSSAQLTRTLRELLRDSLSIRDLRAILDRLLSFETIKVEVGQSHVSDDRLPLLRGAAVPLSVQYLDFIRHGLKHRLVRDHVENHLMVTLDGATQTRFENGLRRRAWPSDRQLRALKDALGSEIERWGGAMPATVLVRPTIRWHVRRMLGVEFPDVAVLATTEVPVEVTLHPAITLGSSGRSGAVVTVDRAVGPEGIVAPALEAR